MPVLAETPAPESGPVMVSIEYRVGIRVDLQRGLGHTSGLKLKGADAMPTIPIGAKGTFTLVVAPEHLANRFKDATLPPVLATPIMIMMMENAALNALKPYLEAGQSAVGSHVDVSHLAATKLGRSVTAVAEVTARDGRRIEFAVEASDDRRKIGTGTHQRMLIDVAAFSARLDESDR